MPTPSAPAAGSPSNRRWASVRHADGERGRESAPRPASESEAGRARGDTYIHLLNTHILNQDILDAIDIEYTALIGRAPAAPPAGPGGAAVAGARPTDWGMQMWVWLHTTYGRANQTGLLESNQDMNWANTKITDVGIDRETIRRFYSHLTRLNREMVNPVLAIKVWTKFMSQITFPRLLSDMAQRELQNPTFVFAAGPNVGQPDLPPFRCWRVRRNVAIHL